MQIYSSTTVLYNAAHGQQVALIQVGAPLGNQNAARANLFRAALLRALRKRSASERLEALDEIADALIDAARAGDLNSIRETVDRLDGKAVQAIEGSVAISHAFAVPIPTDDQQAEAWAQSKGR